MMERKVNHLKQTKKPQSSFWKEFESQADKKPSATAKLKQTFITRFVMLMHISWCFTFCFL